MDSCGWPEHHEGKGGGVSHITLTQIVIADKWEYIIPTVVPPIWRKTHILHSLTSVIYCSNFLSLSLLKIRIRAQ